jgi:5-methyltetrahydrofolate--homocysteine methyltransferase
VHPLLLCLVAKGPVLTDGAWGTELQARGLPIGEFPDLWNLANPDKVADVARSYVECGSDIILTNTFGANRLRLASHNLADRVAEINRSGVEISLSAADDRALVFASIGPTGKLLLMGETTPEELKAVFEEQASALAKAGAQGLVIETMADLEEASIAVAASCATGLPVVACMVFDSGRDKDRTSMGVTIEQAAQTLSKAGADVVGANCGQGISGFIHICKRLRKSTDLPVWIKANAGMPELIDGRTVYRTTPEDFACHTGELIKAGASFLGGCCGTNPSFIRAIKCSLGRAP